MEVGGISVRIVGGREVQNGYVELEHGQTYKVQFSNSTGKRGDINLNIDGVDQGTWRIEAYHTFTVERPTNQDGLFTFFASNSSEGIQAGSLETARQDRGLVQVTFTPEFVRPSIQVREVPSVLGASKGVFRRNAGGFHGENTLSSYPTFPSDSPETYSSGVTGLTGQSNQHFGKANRISLDYSGQVVVNLRLVVVDRPQIRRLRPVNSNPVPSAVD